MSNTHADLLDFDNPVNQPLIVANLVLFPREFEELVAITQKNIETIESTLLQSEQEIRLFHALHSLNSGLKRARGQDAR